MRSSRLVLAALLPLLLLTACGDDNSSGGGKTKVTIALDWLPNTNHTGVFVAKQKGWYEAEGLDVTILPYAEGATPDVQVAAGKADFGFSFEEAVAMARAAKRPVVSVAAVIQKNSSALVALKSSGIERPAQLSGKRYAGFGMPFEEPVISAMIQCDGGQGKFESVTANTFGFEALQAKQADFVWIFMGWEGLVASRQNVALNAMSPTRYCVPDYYTPVIISNEKFLKDRADVARKFMKATARGYDHAIANPDDAADTLIAANPPGTFPDTALVKESARFLAPKYKEGVARWGEQSLQVWTDYPKFMITSGKLVDGEGKPVKGDLDYKAMFSNDYLPK